jgi:hypothetical protein
MRGRETSVIGKHKRVAALGAVAPYEIRFLLALSRSKRHASKRPRFNASSHIAARVHLVWSASVSKFALAGRR